MIPILIKFGSMRLENDKLFFSWLSVKLPTKQLISCLFCRAKLFFFFLFILIKIHNISIFNCFSFFFLFKKIFYIFICSAIQFFFSLNISFTFLIMFSSSRLKPSIIICCEKKNLSINSFFINFLKIILYFFSYV